MKKIIKKYFFSYYYVNIDLLLKNVEIIMVLSRVIVKESLLP